MKITKSQLKKIIKEEVELMIEDGHIDVPSASRKLKTSIEDVGDILHFLEMYQGDLPSWWMSKITLASDYLDKCRDYLLMQESLDEDMIDEKKLSRSQKAAFDRLLKRTPMRPFIERYGKKKGKNIYYGRMTNLAKRRG